MSLIITDNGAFSFSEFCLLEESIKPIPVNYGTDDKTSNGEIGFNGYVYFTFFTHKDYIYAIAINKNDGEVGFAQIPVNTKDIKRKLMLFSDKQTGAGDAIKIFSHTFYVISEIIRNTNLTVIRFHGANKNLGLMYGKLTENKFFLSELEKLGFKFKGKVGSYYLFGKVMK